jgi:hypothetical protein
MSAQIPVSRIGPGRDAFKDICEAMFVITLHPSGSQMNPSGHAAITKTTNIITPDVLIRIKIGARGTP